MAKIFKTAQDAVTESQIWKSIFRHGYAMNRRNRLLMITNNVFYHILPTKISRYGMRMRFHWGAGIITFYLFMVLTFTGVLLMFYYTPTVPRAYYDLKDLQFVVPFGNLLRNMHRYGAHAMVFMVMVHMARTFYTSSYKAPREYNWVVGVILLTLTFLLSFSGYLLPWDQLAIWAVTVGTNMARATPLLGYEGPLSNLLGMRVDNDVRFALLGGTTVGQATLLRFYVLHCIAFPLATTAFIVVHFWRVRRDGFSGDVPISDA
jgi:quinol-cytochrome oxidoreductase complex cytochrome b subunit